MSSVRTSVILAVLAAGLLGFILLYERGTPSSGDVERNKEHPLPGLTREHLRRVELQHDGALTVLSRDAAEQDDADTPWRVEAPYRAEADREVVETLLSDLESMQARRRMTGISSEDRKGFGLANPRFRVWLTTGGTRTLLLVGNQSPRGDGVYVEGSVPGVAYIVDKRIVETLSQPATAYHSKALLPDLHPEQVASVSIRDADGERRVERDGDVFRLKAPQVALASSSRMSSLLQSLDGLRAAHFVKQAPSAEDLTKDGLAQPSLALTLARKPAPASNGAPKLDAPFELKFGNACVEHPGERYATAGGALMCVADAEIAKLHPVLAELREPRLLPFDNDATLTSVQLERGGQQLKLDKGASGWSYEVTRGNQSVLKGAAREQAVTDWLEALRSTKAAGYRAGELAAAGGEPVRLAISRAPATKGAPAVGPYAAQLAWEAAASELLAHRSDEPDLAMYPAAAAALLTPDAARFRSLEVAKLEESSLRDIEIRRAGQVERLSRADGGKTWSITAPIHAPVDARRMQDLVHALGALEAVRFVADAPSPGYGLETPECQLSVEYESSGKDAPRQRFGLRVGGTTEGGRFAQLEGQPGVFVLARDIAALLLEPLVSRTGLAMPVEQIQSVTLQRAGRTLQIKKPSAEDPASAASADSAATRELFETLATLRASRITNYGPALAAEGFAHPAARVTLALTSDAGQPAATTYTLEFGAAAPEGRYARRTDWPVRFVVPASSADVVVSTFGARPTTPQH